MTKPKSDVPTHWNAGPELQVPFADLILSHLLRIDRTLRESISEGKRVAWSQRYLRAVELEISHRQAAGENIERLPDRAKRQRPAPRFVNLRDTYATNRSRHDGQR